MGTRTGVVKSPNVQRLRIKVPKRDQFRGEGAAMESTTLLSKLRDAVRSRSRIDAGFCFGNVPLPLGECGAKRRVRAGNASSSGPSGHLLPEGEGHEPPFRLIWTRLQKRIPLLCKEELPRHQKDDAEGHQSWRGRGGHLHEMFRGLTTPSAPSYFFPLLRGRH